MSWNGNDTIFRTYFHGKRKSDKNKVRCIPAEKVKDGEGHPFDEVKDDMFFGAVLNDGYIDISFDTECNPRFYSSPKESLSVTLSEGTV